MMKLFQFTIETVLRYGVLITLLVSASACGTAENSHTRSTGGVTWVDQTSTKPTDKKPQKLTAASIALGINSINASLTTNAPEAGEAVINIADVNGTATCFLSNGKIVKESLQAVSRTLSGSSIIYGLSESLNTIRQEVAKYQGSGVTVSCELSYIKLGQTRSYVASGDTYDVFVLENGSEWVEYSTDIPVAMSTVSQFNLTEADLDIVDHTDKPAQ